MSRYQGGKNGAGVYQTIINCIPAHRRYIEAFAGSAAIFRNKAPAPDGSWLIEASWTQAEKLRRDLASSDVQVLQGDALGMLPLWSWGPDDFVYLDPPYHPSARRDLNLYEVELSADGHQQLLHSILPAMSDRGARWALSGYRCAVYDDAYRRFGWHRLDYRAMTRRGVVTESLWTNFDPATVDLHDTAYVGANFRERERIGRKVRRWVAKLEALPAPERQAIMRALSTEPARLATPAGPDDATRCRRPPARAAMAAATAAGGDGIPPPRLAMVAASPAAAGKYS